MPYFKKISIEISSLCNANCKYCTTGMRNRERECLGGNHKAYFMDRDRFASILDYCLEKQIVDKTADVELYDWAEPLINPHVLEILDCIIERGMKFNISTNGSKKVIFTDEQIQNMEYLMFSVSGFSQETYGKYHALNLQRVLKNIEEMIVPFKGLGMLDKIDFNYHVYQDNIGEIGKAFEFCQKLGIRFVPRYAYIADWNLCNQYMTGAIESGKLKELSKDLFFHYYDKVISNQPQNYQCAQSERLYLSAFGKVLPCAWATEEDSAEDIFTLSGTDIQGIKKNYHRCSTCLSTGQAWLFQQYTEFLSEYDNVALEPIRYFGKYIEPTIYWTTNDDFNESQKQTIKCVIRKDDSYIVHFRIKEESAVRQIRFDPCYFNCTLVDTEIYCNGLKVNFSPYMAESIDEGKFKFTNGNPCLVTEEINAPITTVEIRGKIK